MKNQNAACDARSPELPSKDEKLSREFGLCPVIMVLPDGVECEEVVDLLLQSTDFPGINECVAVVGKDIFKLLEACVEYQPTLILDFTSDISWLAQCFDTFIKLGLDADDIIAFWDPNLGETVEALSASAPSDACPQQSRYDYWAIN